MNVPWWNTQFEIEEIKAVIDAISHKNITMGNITKLFEKNMAKILQVPYIVSMPSGSVSLFVALKVLGIKAGDEVIVPDRTFIATAHAVLLTGAKVVLVDVKKKNTNMDISKIEEKITKKTKAFIPVHLNGRAVNMDKINKLAKQYNLHVIEDASQALFSKTKNGKYIGTSGTLGCFSMGMAKLLNVGYGGFIATKDKKLYKKLVKFRNHGRLTNAHGRYDALGFNFKVSDIIMAIGNVQIEKREKKIAHCKKIYKLYKEGLKGLQTIQLIPVKLKNEVPIYVEVVALDKKRLIKYLKENGITINLLPPSLHMSKHLKQEINNFPNSLYFHKNSFILPSGPNQSFKNIMYVINVLREYDEGN